MKAYTGVEVQLWAFLTSSLDGVFHDPDAVLPESDPRYPLNTRLGGAPAAVWILWRREKSFAPKRKPKQDSSVVHPVA
jgi:hypothetical protein